MTSRYAHLALVHTVGELYELRTHARARLDGVAGYEARGDAASYHAEGELVDAADALAAVEAELHRRGVDLDGVYWVTKDKRLVRPEALGDQHLVNVVAMVERAFDRWFEISSDHLALLNGEMARDAAEEGLMGMVDQGPGGVIVSRELWARLMAEVQRRGLTEELKAALERNLKKLLLRWTERAERRRAKEESRG